MGTSFSFVGWSLSFIVGIFAEDYKALQDGCDRNILLCCQLSPLSVGQQYRRCVGLETCDGLGLSRLAHDIHSLSPNQDKCLKKTKPPFFQLKRSSNECHLSDSNRHGQGSLLLVKGHQHTWLHGCHQAVQDVVRFSQNYCRIQWTPRKATEQRKQWANVALKEKKKMKRRIPYFVTIRRAITS